MKTRRGKNRGNGFQWSIGDNPESRWAVLLSTKAYADTHHYPLTPEDAIRLGKALIAAGEEAKQ